MEEVSAGYYSIDKQEYRLQKKLRTKDIENNKVSARSRTNINLKNEPELDINQPNRKPSQQLMLGQN